MAMEFADKSVNAVMTPVMYLVYLLNIAGVFLFLGGFEFVE